MGRAAWRRKKRRRKINLLPVMITIAALLFVSSLVLFFTDSFGFTASLRTLLTASQVEEFDSEGLKVIDSDYTIDAPGEKLENTHITGNLYLAPEIGDGNVDLISVVVDGAVLVRGGGLKSIFFRDCTLNEVKVNRPEGRVRLVFSGDTIVENIDLETSSRLVENLAEGATGVKSIQLLTDEQVELVGNFEAVQVLVREANLKIESELLKHLTVANTAGGTTIYYSDDIFIENLQIDGSVNLFGRGSVNQAVISANGTSELEGSFNRVKVTSEAGSFELVEGSDYQELIVAVGALNNLFHLYDDVTVNLMELNEAVDIKGQGEIIKVIINAAGSTMEQIPHEIEFLQEVSVFIDGHEILTPDMLKALREHGDPEYVPLATASNQEQEPAPEPNPEPQQSSAPSEQPAPEPAPQPDPKPEPAPQPDSDPEPEPVPQPVPEPGPDNESTEEASSPPGFKLEIISPADSNEILTQGKNLLYVTLNTNQPENYRVTLEGTVEDDAPLRYLEQANKFFTLINKETEKSNLENKIVIVPID